MAADVISSAWPVLVTMAFVGGARVRSSRKRRALNRAMHELRRPLQALALAPGPGFRRARAAAPGSLELALAALDDLDVAINGTRPALSRRPIAARPLIEASLERWEGPAAGRGRPLSLEWRAGQAIVMADPARLAQALDNLLANAIEHGGQRVHVAATRSPVGLRISVSSATGGATPPGRPDPRRGHGLAVVERVAAAHLGRFQIARGPHEVSAVLELPLAPTPLPAVPIEWASGRRPMATAAGSARAARPAPPHAA